MKLGYKANTALAMLNAAILVMQLTARATGWAALAAALLVWCAIDAVRAP